MDSVLQNPFFQSAPKLLNQFDDDEVLRSYIAHRWPKDIALQNQESLRSLGELSAGSLYELQLADRLNEPELVQWDAWGKRVDRIELTPLWKEAAKVAVQYGLVATAYEKRFAEWSRAVQFAHVYLFDPSSDVYTCPLAMTDGAAKTLSVSKNAALIARAVPRLTSRDPDTAWTSGQWMTERTGGSDVGLTQTVAKKDGDQFRIYGTKWFTSATTSEMALTLARPEGNPGGGRGLALFYVERSLADGSPNHILVNRLKDKLGTRKVPTAELTLDGAYATPVIGLADGIRHIAPMLNVTRTWNAVCSVAIMRRALALAESYAKQRYAFGSMLETKPLHVETLLGLRAEYEAMFHLTMATTLHLGREEAGHADSAALLRVLTPLVKLATAKAAVLVTSEVCESFGGAGYVEDTGIPRLLRDAQVLPIWEGTTNVLSLDVMKTISTGDTLEVLRRFLDTELTASEGEVPKLIRQVFQDVVGFAAGPHAEAGARHVALTLARLVAAAILHRFVTDSEDDRAKVSLNRFCKRGVSSLHIFG